MDGNELRALITADRTCGKPGVSLDFLHALNAHAVEFAAALDDRDRLTFIINESNEGRGWLDDGVWDEAGMLCIEECMDGQLSIRAAIDTARSAK